MQGNIKNMKLTYMFITRMKRTYITIALRKFRNVTTQTISSLELCFSRKYISHFLDENVHRNGGVVIVVSTMKIVDHFHRYRGKFNPVYQMLRLSKCSFHLRSSCQSRQLIGVQREKQAENKLL